MPKNDIQKQGRILMLPVDCIEPSPYQARTAFDEPEIAALAVSILQNGLLQPISVRRVGIRKYQLVAGERRLRACRLAKLEKVPAILADYDDSESAALGLLENLQRSQLDPFDTARGIKEVIRLWGCTQAEAARRLVLPDALRKLPQPNLYRLIFNGRSSLEPVIANMVLECGCPVNIMYADTRDINGVAFGQMVLQLPEREKSRTRIMAYARAHSIMLEEMKHV